MTTLKDAGQEAAEFELQSDVRKDVVKAGDVHVKLPDSTGMSLSVGQGSRDHLQGSESTGADEGEVCDQVSNTDLCVIKLGTSTLESCKNRIKETKSDVREGTKGPTSSVRHTAEPESCPCVTCVIARTLNVEECIAMTLGELSDTGRNDSLADFKKAALDDADKLLETCDNKPEHDAEYPDRAMGTDEQPENLETKPGVDPESEYPGAKDLKERLENIGTEPFVGSESPGAELDQSNATESCIHADTALESGACEKMEEGEQEMLEAEEQQQLPEIEYCFSSVPSRITGAWAEFKNKDENFLKGCKWSPDGTCLLTNSDDNQLRLFNLPPEVWSQQTDNLPELSSVLKMKEGDLIYDYCWYPRMSSQDPVSCCLVSTCRDNPVHMWDAFTGELRCTYRAYDQADEITSAYSVAFSNSGDKLYCGFNGAVRIFDINRPGRDCETRQNKAMVTVSATANRGHKRKKGKAKKTVTPAYQRGILSCIAVSPDDGLYAVGSYAKTVSIYCAVSGEMMCLLDGHAGGITHIKFSPDGNYIYSGGRKDPEILCWDVRSYGKPLFSLRRTVETNQRMYFDLDRTGRYLVSGNHDGTTSVWDLSSAQESDNILEPMLRFRTHSDTNNGVSLHPYLPLLATGSGQQHFTSSGPLSGDSSESDSDEMDLQEMDNSLHLWWLGPGAEMMDS
ncbi:telomerase Cajal body protein 1-like [Lineus longissimus]|uniref:telomerase Cajal body protein 1-like n=1 Tax=Lineus longissimus TaxID=88925 RepID=UPI00315C8B76